MKVALALMSEPFGRHWGYETSKRAGVRPGALYPVLHGMLERGWLSDGWIEVKRARGKPDHRRYYELTDEGRMELGALQARAWQNAVRHELPGKFA